MRFVIIAAPRTGSTHLSLLLHGRKDVYCNGEIFHKRDVFVRWPAADLRPEIREELNKLKRTAPEVLLDRVFERSYGRTHVGFKMLFNHGEEILQRLLKDASIRKILLFRGNALASYASGLAAHVTQKWHVRAGGSVPETPKVKFDEEEFLRFHRRRTAQYRRAITQLNLTNQAFHLVRYEEINEPLLFARLVAFLGADASMGKLRTKRAKLNSSDIVSRFANAGAVEDFLLRFDLMHWKYEGQSSFSGLGGESAEEATEPLETDSPPDSPGERIKSTPRSTVDRNAAGISDAGDKVARSAR